MAQYIRDGGFESAGYWNLSDRVSIVNHDQQSGSYCLEFRNQWLGGALIARQITRLKAGQAYTLRWSAKRSGRYDIWCAFAYFDASGTRHYQDSPSMESQLGTSYSSFSYTFVVPPGATGTVEIDIKAGADISNGASLVYVDNVSLCEKSPADSWLTNGSFELGGNSWYLPSGCSVVTGAAQSGSKYLLSSHGTGGVAHTIGQYLNLIPGKTYTLASKFQAIGPECSCMVGFQYTNSAGTLVEEYGTRVNGNATWKDVTRTFTLPSNASPAVWAVIIVMTNKTYTNTGGMIDNVTLRDGTGGSTGPDPADSHVWLGTRYLTIPVGRSINIYADMSTSSHVVCAMQRGEKVVVYNTSNANWIYVQTTMGLEGYMQYASNLLSETALPSLTYVGEQYINVPPDYYANVFKEAGSGTAHFQLERGARVYVYNAGNANYMYIQTTTTTAIQEGYVHKNLLLTTQPKTLSSLGVQYITCRAGYSIPLFVDTSSSSATLYTCSRGAAVRTFSVTGASGWIFVHNVSTGAFGFYFNTAVSTTAPRAVTPLGTRYIQASPGYGRRVYKEPTTTSASLGVWNHGAQVTAYSITDATGWTLVQNSTGTEGYTYTSGLSTQPQSGGAYIGRRYANATTYGAVLLYDTASNAGTPKVDYLSRGEEVSVWDAGQAGYSFVRTLVSPTKEGYCLSSSLVTSPPGPEINLGYTIGNFVKIKGAGPAGVPVRRDASTSNEYIGRLRNDSLMLCVGVTESSGGNIWVKVRWCGMKVDGTEYDYAYIPGGNVEDAGEAPSDKMDAALKIAKSLADKSYTYNNLGLSGGKWCVSFLIGMMKAAGANDRPSWEQLLVSEARGYYGGDSVDRVDEDSREPAIGDWVFYKDDNDIHAHVGFVTDVSGNYIKTVEGNVGANKETVLEYDEFTSYKVRNTVRMNQVQSFATPDWSL